MIMALLDTNIYNRILTQAQPGCEIEWFGKLKRLAAESKVRVVVPEVVVLEFEKFCRHLQSLYAERLAKLESAVKDAVGRKEIWNELDDVKKDISALLEKTRKEKPKLFKDRQSMIQDWLSSDAVMIVPFTTDIWLKGKKRRMAGRMPNGERTSDQDSCIIESVLTVLGSDDELYFCSNDTSDFAVTLEKGDLALHPILRESLPNTVFFSNLKTMVDAIRDRKRLLEPSREDLEKAVRRAAKRPRFLAVLQRIRPLVEYYLVSMDPLEDNHITNPRFAELCHEFSKSSVRNAVRQPRLQSGRRVVREIRNTLTEMAKHNTVIEWEVVRRKRSTTTHQMALELLADQFIELHDELLDIWKVP